jgi:hypothetical protein
MTDEQLERAWSLYRSSSCGAKSGWFDDKRWAVCVERATPKPAFTAPCTEEAFVVAWEAGKTLAEAAMLAGYTGPNGSRIASERARRMRQRGVKLRAFTPGPTATQKRRKLSWMAARARKEAR